MIQAVSSHGSISGNGSSITANRSSSFNDAMLIRSTPETKQYMWMRWGLTVAVHREAAVRRRSVSCYLWRPFWGILFIGQLSVETNQNINCCRGCSKIRELHVFHMGCSRNHKINSATHRNSIFYHCVAISNISRFSLYI